jgi:hypothetical protein
MMILEWGGVPEYRAWPDQPVYRTYKLSQIIDRPDELLRAKMHCRVTIDLPITFEEANFIKETMIPQYNLREMTLIPVKGDSVSDDSAQADLKFESVDKIILEGISNIESDFYDIKLLLEIYQNT